MRLLGRRVECEALDRAVADARSGRSRVMVLRGDAGVGKTALLDHAAGRLDGWQIARAGGVESEMELAYSGLHQLCAPVLDRLDRLPDPQQAALATLFGRGAGRPPDRFMVGLATLTLLAEMSEDGPLAVLIDDGQWLDHASAQVLGFVARRLFAEPILLLGATRSGPGDAFLDGLPELAVHGLSDDDALALLLEHLIGPLDVAVCDQIIAESHGNPLALLELPRTWSRSALAGGFGLPGTTTVVGKIERSYAQRLLQLPPATRLLVLAAAAEPLGDPLLLQRAANHLGIDMTAALPSLDAGLLTIKGRVEFAHPLLRSVAYRSATPSERQRVHRALADATDHEADPDRRAWHRARATASPDQAIAAELEHAAGRAEERGGLAAAAAFLERAAELTPDARSRGQRYLAAASAKRLAGLPHDALAIVDVAARDPLDDSALALAQRIRGQVALDLRRGAEAAALLLDAARRLETIDVAQARKTHLEALWAASYAGRFGDLWAAAEAARAAPRTDAPSTATDLLLDGLAIRVVEGYAPSAPLLKKAVALIRLGSAQPAKDAVAARIAVRVASSLFDGETWDFLATREVHAARDTGQLSALPVNLGYLAMLRIHEGQLDAAGRLLQEADAIAGATGSAPGPASALLAACRGDEITATRLLAVVEADATERADGVVRDACEHARAVLHNGLGYYTSALVAAKQAVGADRKISTWWVLAELIEAAARAGEPRAARDALADLAERSAAAGTDIARGIERRSQALLATDADADDAHREALDALERTTMRLWLARTHLAYGEWLRRIRRRTDARDHLRAAHAMFTEFGAAAFAERSRNELMATGERVRKRRDQPDVQLTSQEEQIAALARDGFSNPEIGARLFISPRTVEWHLRRVYIKLGISSRRGLRLALASAQQQAAPTGNVLDGKLSAGVTSFCD